MLFLDHKLVLWVLMNISAYLTNLTAHGVNTFTKEDITFTLKKSPIAIQNALWRLKRKYQVAEPTRGFYVNVTPEYRILECLPADHFIHALMQYLNTPYYIGLLSAAEYHGASHQKSQLLQVMTQQKRRSIHCGKVGILFVTKKNLLMTPTQEFASQHSVFLISTAEATAMDLVSYPHRCGGMENVFMVLSELIENMNPGALQELTNQEIYSITWMQRLGFLLEQLEAFDLSDVLLNALKKHRVQKTSLIDASYQKNISYNEKWKLIINAQLELEI